MKRLLLISFITLIAMTGTAMAYTADIWDAAGNGPVGDLSLKPGESVTLSYRMQAISELAEQGKTFTYSQSVTVFSGTGDASDITVTFNPTTVNVPYASTYTHVGVINVKLDENAPAGTIYRISIGAGPSDSIIEVDSASRYVESIPEFPTVALPVAAILGLAFVFMRRKE